MSTSINHFLFQSPLPHVVDVLCTCSRWMAYAMLAPIAVLALVDVVGWSIHKVLLRPLGYARTVRFKDPDPPSMLVAVKVPSASSIVEALPRKERSPTHTDALDSSSSTSSSPIIRYSSLSPSDSLESPPLSRSTSCSPPQNPPPALQGGYPVLRRSSSTGSDLSDTFYKRHRAASIGVEGPLFSGEELQSPGRSDDEELLSSEAESDSPEFAGTLRRRRTERTGMPRGGPAFGFTNLGDRTR